MRKLLAALLCSWCSCASAQTAQELIDNGKNTENVTTFGMGYNLNQYSPLKQINKSNVKRLVPIWATSLINEAASSRSPTVYNGVMYVVNGNWTFALDVETGEQIWRTPVEYDRAAARVGAPGVIMRGGAAIYNGKLFRETIDSHVIALDMKTGKEVWKQKFADCKEGYYRHHRAADRERRRSSPAWRAATAPRAASSIGWDPETGQKLWPRYTIPAPGEPGRRRGRRTVRCLEIRRRLDLAERLLRSRTRSRLLGHRQRRAVQPGLSRRRRTASTPRA